MTSHSMNFLSYCCQGHFEWQKDKRAHVRVRICNCTYIHCVCNPVRQVQKAMSRKYSHYFYELEDTEKCRYTQKLDKLGGIDDPYLQEPSVVGEDWNSWPSVEYPDIYNYLIQTPSLYTGESLKAYKKSLEAYNYYINGWIDDFKVVEITKLVEPHYYGDSSYQTFSKTHYTACQTMVSSEAEWHCSLCPLFMYGWSW